MLNLGVCDLNGREVDKIWWFGRKKTIVFWFEELKVGVFRVAFLVDVFWYGDHYNHSKT